MDVVREFQVVTSGGQAEFGRALGGYMNVATKSGTNDLHGTAYGYLRNQRLNAMNALSRTKLPLTQGEYGASLSGRLKRDKAFFFGNFEEQRLRTDGVVTVLPANAVAINSQTRCRRISGSAAAGGHEFDDLVPNHATHGYRLLSIGRAAREQRPADGPLQLLQAEQPECAGQRRIE